MNLFVAGRSVTAAEARAKLAAVVDRLPFFPGQEIRTWTSTHGGTAAAWISHPPEVTGGVTYADEGPDRIELWSGHRQGRFARIVATDDGIDLDTDPMGSYPLYGTDDGWVSNNPTVLRTSDDMDLQVVASLIAGGWSLSGNPIRRGVRRIDRPIGPDEVVPMIGRGLDARAAAHELADVTRALMDWSGRPSVVPVTAGRDSRLILAAAQRAGIPFTTNTGGRPGEPDVDIGRELAALLGAEHRLIPDDPHGALHSHWRQAAHLLEYTTGGTASLADAVGFPHGPREGPLPLWHSGQGGEIARSYYARVRGDNAAQLTDSLYAAFTMRRPGRREPLNADGQTSVRDQIGDWVEATLAAGAQPGDVPDLFYLFQRMGRWAGPTHGAVEYVRDTTSPLWHRRMLPHLVALPAEDRAAERFHYEVLEELSPELAEAPAWFTPSTPLQRRTARARYVARRAAEELRRRTARSQAHAPAPSNPARADPFDPVRAQLRDRVLSQAEHRAWAVIDRDRVEELLTTPGDEVQTYYVWRIATLFGTTA